MAEFSKMVFEMLHSTSHEITNWIRTSDTCSISVVNNGILISYLVRNNKINGTQSRVPHKYVLGESVSVSVNLTVLIVSEPTAVIQVLHPEKSMFSIIACALTGTSIALFA